MKKLYRSLFYVPKHATVSDKTFTIQLILSVMLILISMAMMSLSAYALFTNSVSSQANVITASHYEITVAETPEGISLGSDGYYLINNTPDVVETVETLTDEESGQETGTMTFYDYGEIQTDFSFTLSKTGTATTSYCIIEMLTDYDGFSEPQITYSRIFTGGDDSEVVTVHVPAGNVLKIRFIPEWKAQEGPVFLSSGIIRPEYGTPVLPVLPEPVVELIETAPDTGEQGMPEEQEEQEEPEEPEEQEEPTDRGNPEENAGPDDSEEPADQSEPSDSVESLDEEDSQEPADDLAEGSGQTSVTA